MTVDTANRTTMSMDFLGDIDFNIDDLGLLSNDTLTGDLTDTMSLGLPLVDDEWALRRYNSKSTKDPLEPLSFEDPDPTFLDNLFQLEELNQPKFSAEHAHSIATQLVPATKAKEPFSLPEVVEPTSLAVAKTLRDPALVEVARKRPLEIEELFSSNKIPKHYHDSEVSTDDARSTTSESTPSNNNNGSKKHRMKKECKLQALQDREQLLLRENSIMMQHLRSAGVECPLSDQVDVTLKADNPRRDRRRRKAKTNNQQLNIDPMEVRARYYTKAGFSMWKLENDKLVTSMCNPDYLSLCGRSPAEIVDAPFDKFFVDNKEADSADRIAEQLRAGKQVVANVMCVKSDGEQYWEQLIATPMMDDKSKVVCVTCVHNQLPKGPKPAAK